MAIGATAAPASIPCLTIDRGDEKNGYYIFPILVFDPAFKNGKGDRSQIGIWIYEKQSKKMSRITSLDGFKGLMEEKRFRMPEGQKLEEFFL